MLSSALRHKDGLMSMNMSSNGRRRFVVGIGLLSGYSMGEVVEEVLKESIIRPLSGLMSGIVLVVGW